MPLITNLVPSRATNIIIPRFWAKDSMRKTNESNHINFKKLVKTITFPEEISKIAEPLSAPALTPPHSPLPSPPVINRHNNPVKLEIEPRSLFKQTKRSSEVLIQSIKSGKFQQMPLRHKLRLIAPLRIWFLIGLLIIVIVAILIYVMRKHVKLYEQSYSLINSERRQPQTKNKTAVVVSTLATIILTGMTSRLTLTAINKLIEKSPATKRFLPKIFDKILPKSANIDGHEIVLYAMNFIMIYQSVRIWRNWQTSPLSAAIARWNNSKINRILQFVNGRKAARIAAKAAREAAGGGRGCTFNLFSSSRGGKRSIFKGLKGVFKKK